MDGGDGRGGTRTAAAIAAGGRMASAHRAQARSHRLAHHQAVNGHRPDRPPPRFQGDPAFEALVEPRPPVATHEGYPEQSNGAHAPPLRPWAAIFGEDPALPV